jgi:enoyl-CoA hydratase
MKKAYCDLKINEKRKIATITFNRPEKLNAISLEGIDEWRMKMQQAETDENVKVIILKGAGRCFGTGFDAAEIGPHIGIGKPGERRASQRQRLLAMGKVHYGVTGYCNLPYFILKPVVAQVHGYCYGGHFEIATACDITIASDDAKFTHPGYRMIGPLPDGMVTLFLTIGVKRTKELMFTGKSLSAQEALAYGLVNKVVPSDKLDDAVNETVETIVKQPFDGLVMGKANFQMALDFAGAGHCMTAGYMAHTWQTNIRYEPDEFNLVGARGKKGLKAALEEREKLFGNSRLSDKKK